MDIVLGVSMTATTVRMVLIEGERADGVTIESEAFDTAAADGVAKGSPAEQVSTAILATAQSALRGGHHLVVSGVTCVDPAESVPLRDSIAARGLDNVALVSEQNAAGALAQAVGRALGYSTTAVVLVKPGAASLSVVDSADGSIVEARTCGTRNADAADVLPELVSALEGSGSAGQGVFVVGCDVDVCAVKANLDRLISQPVIVPEEPEWALARGAALAAANTPGFEPSTSGLAYSQDPDTSADAQPIKLSDADTEVAAFDCDEVNGAVEAANPGRSRRVLVPVGSLMAGAFVLGVVALVMSLAVNIRPTVEQGSPLDTKAMAPHAVVPPAVAQIPAVVQPPPAALPAPPAPAPVGPGSAPSAPPAPLPAPSAPPDTSAVLAQAVSPLPPQAAPAPQVQQPAPRRAPIAPAPVADQAQLAAAPVAVDTPLPQAPPPPAPVALPPPPAPVALPLPRAPVALSPPPAPVALPPPPAPVALPPPPAPLAPPPMRAAPPPPAFYPPAQVPATRPPAQPPAALPSFAPPSLWIQTPPSQQLPAQAPQNPQWVQVPLDPRQQAAQPPQQLPGPQIVLLPRRQPQTPQWTPQPSAQMPQSPPAPAPDEVPPQGPPAQRAPWQQQGSYGSPGSAADGAGGDGPGTSGPPPRFGIWPTPWWLARQGQ